ncbi:MAG: hypothetical protein ACD_29C00480G0001 [uncultured bacterium]|nr:MAG: hypothetical protein ACD_29C00480G0001 [uncultured bacterium]OGT32613.1 MAG: lysine transporter [Gammaproteobacteria bacterium RIFCSPHIGHO2_02_FULL_39_13]
MSDELSQRLKARHVNMIAIGGSIGTGIFLASGYTISVGGPGGALFAYIMMALIVYLLMTSLAEMSAYKPTSGTFCEYATLFVGKPFGIAMGYNYWLNWAITIAAEISAASIIMHYWFPHVHEIIFPVLFFVAILLSNLFSVRVYGEIEYGLSFIKVAVIIIFIVLGAVSVFQQPHFGGQNWKIEDAPFHHGWLGFISVFLLAGFSFQGTELVGVASGETENPTETIPKCIKYVFWRLALFYIVSIFIITLLIPFNDPQLMHQNSVQMSPYTLIFSQYLSHYAGDMVNFVILIAVLSAANASMYSATRILWYLGKTNQAPKIFRKTNRFSIPIVALLATALIGSTVFISSIVGNGILFSYLIQISSFSGFIAWFGIALSHYHFRKKYLPGHGGLISLSYRAKGYPYAQLFSMAAICFIIAAQIIPLSNTSSAFHLGNMLALYSSVICFIIFYLIVKLWDLYNR